MTFVEFVAAARGINARATVEVSSNFYDHDGSVAMGFGIYTQAHGWFHAESPSAALALFADAVGRAVARATAESVGELPEGAQ